MRLFITRLAFSIHIAYIKYTQHSISLIRLSSSTPPPLERRANNAHFIETQKNSYFLANCNGVTLCELRSGDNRLLMKFGVTGSRRALRLRYSERAALRYCITVLPFTAGMIDLLASLGRRETRPGTN